MAKARKAGAPATPWEAGPEAEAARETAATKLVNLALSSGAELFRSPDGEPYISVPRGSHRETYGLRTKHTRAWLSALFFENTAKAPSTNSLSDAMNALEGKALFAGLEHRVWIRVAETEDRLYVDLGRPDWQCIEIRPGGWRICGAPPVRFRRPRGSLPLPLPAKHGNLCELRQFVNVASDADFVLLAAFLVSAFRPSRPQPILGQNGEQGSGKSTNARAIRGIIDPSTAPLRSEPREPRDLAVAALNAHLIAFDNISHIAIWLSDALCRLSTGGAFATRVLFTDSDEMLFDAMRPVILTGIEELMVRGDLADRAITITAPTLRDADRITEHEFWNEYAAAAPRILAGALDAVAAGLAGYAEVRLDAWPRLADFAAFSIAAEAAGQWPDGAFLAAYRDNRRAAVEGVLDGDVLAQAVQNLRRYEGTAADLLERLGRAVEVKPKHWPATPRNLSNALRRLAPALRRTGLEVRFERLRDRRLIVIEDGEAAESASRSSQRHTDTGESAPLFEVRDAGDAGDDESPIYADVEPERG